LYIGQEKLKADDGYQKTDDSNQKTNNGQRRTDVKRQISDEW